MKKKKRRRKRRRKSNVTLLYIQNKFPQSPFKTLFRKNNFNIPIQGNSLFHFVILSFYINILSI